MFSGSLYQLYVAYMETIENARARQIKIAYFYLTITGAIFIFCGWFINQKMALENKQFTLRIAATIGSLISLLGGLRVWTIHKIIQTKESILVDLEKNFPENMRPLLLETIYYDKKINKLLWSKSAGEIPVFVIIAMGFLVIGYTLFEYLFL